MTQPNEDLAATYGPAAPFAEHKCGDRITYMTAEGLQSRGTITWVQAPFQLIGVRYIVAPDDPNFALS